MDTPLPYKIGFVCGYIVASVGTLLNYIMFPFPRG